MRRSLTASRWPRAVPLCLPVATLTAAAAFAAPPSAAPPSAAELAAPAGFALVIGNATYPGLPALPACLTSAHAVSAALRRLHFSVVEQEDATAGYMDGALAQFAQQVRQADRPPTMIYSCGYASAFNDRPFLLPVSAVVNRPADLLTQAALARSVLVAGTQANAGASLAVLDVVPMLGAPSDLGLASPGAFRPVAAARSSGGDGGSERGSADTGGECPDRGAGRTTAGDGQWRVANGAGASGVQIVAAQAPAMPWRVGGSPCASDRHGSGTVEVDRREARGSASGARRKHRGHGYRGRTAAPPCRAKTR